MSAEVPANAKVPADAESSLSAEAAARAAPFPPVVAEVAQAHDGSLGTAHAFVDAVADAGADAIKFQTHIAAAESSREEPWRVHFSPQDASRYDYWRRMEFTEDQWRGLREHADERGLAFMSSPFSDEAFDLLSRVGVSAWKAASGEVATPGLLDRMLTSGKPVLVSTGMSDWAEIDGVVSRANAADASFALLQCTSRYPSGPEDAGLNVLSEMKVRYGAPVGLSDHSGTIFPSLAAVALGADVVEVHVTLSRRAFGPDQASSVTIDELAQLCRGSEFLRTARAHPVDKDAMARELAPVRALFSKSAVAVRALPAGHRIVPGDLAPRKPGTGIPAARIPALEGRVLRRAVPSGDLLREADLEPPTP